MPRSLEVDQVGIGRGLREAEAGVGVCKPCQAGQCLPFTDGRYPTTDPGAIPLFPLFRPQDEVDVEQQDVVDNAVKLVVADRPAVTPLLKGFECSFQASD